MRYPHDVNKMCVLFGPLLLLLLCCFFLLLGCYKNYNSIQYYDVLKNVLFLIIIIINRDDDDDFINTTITIITVSYPQEPMCANSVMMMQNTNDIRNINTVP